MYGVKTLGMDGGFLGREALAVWTPQSVLTVQEQMVTIPLRAG